MSISGYLGKPRSGVRADGRDTSGVGETARVYERVEQYDAVLRSHCGLGESGAKAGSPPRAWAYWLRAVEGLERRTDL